MRELKFTAVLLFISLGLGLFFKLTSGRRQSDIKTEPIAKVEKMTFDQAQPSTPTLPDPASKLNENLIEPADNKTEDQPVALSQVDQLAKDFKGTTSERALIKITNDLVTLFPSSAKDLANNILNSDAPFEQKQAAIVILEKLDAPALVESFLSNAGPNIDPNLLDSYISSIPDKMSLETRTQIANKLKQIVSDGQSEELKTIALESLADYEMTHDWGKEYVSYWINNAKTPEYKEMMAFFAGVVGANINSSLTTQDEREMFQVGKESRSKED